MVCGPTDRVQQHSGRLQDAASKPTVELGRDRLSDGWDAILGLPRDMQVDLGINDPGHGKFVAKATERPLKRPGTKTITAQTGRKWPA
jgi:hypothetical protein